jgi:hypothetical protein
MIETNYLSKYVSIAHNIAPELLFKKTRKAKVVAARNDYWYLLRYACGWSFPRIGEHTGHDHTTVSHGVAKVEVAKRYTPEDTNRLYRAIEEERQNRLTNRRKIAPVDKLLILPLRGVDKVLRVRIQVEEVVKPLTVPPSVMHSSKGALNPGGRRIKSGLER